MPLPWPARPQRIGETAADRHRRNRQAAEKRGRLAETLAAWLLRLKGYRILARDFRSPVGEIDLVARRGGLLAFVEVKRRARAGEAIESITPRQRRRIVRAAAAFCAGAPDLERLDCRFDVVLVFPGRPPRHIEDAWRP